MSDKKSGYIICAFCGLVGHVKGKCPDLHPVELEETTEQTALVAA